MSILEAATFQVVDELGIDPLRDKSYDAVMAVRNYTWHTVELAEENNGPLLSYNVFSNPDYWRYIMMFNGLLDMFEIKAGMRLKIPAHQELVSQLNNTLIDRDVRTVRI